MRLRATACAGLCLVWTAAPVPAAGPPAVKGIEAGDLDRSFDPCVDFFGYANGSWRAQNPVPPSMLRWSRRWAAGESAKEGLKTILDEVSARTDWPKGSVEQLIGDYYGACMDEKRIDQLGLDPLKPMLKQCQGSFVAR
jgi:endothelin-converting enzyme/putative endopeptidase